MFQGLTFLFILLMLAAMTEEIFAGMFNFIVASQFAIAAQLIASIMILFLIVGIYLLKEI